jgi:hypothetical protein
MDRDGDTSECVDVVAAAGVATLGKHDIFAIVSAYKEDPLNSLGGHWPKLDLLGAMGDARGATLIVDTWTAQIPRAERFAKSSNVMEQWSSWRKHAAAKLGLLGGDKERDFLDAQAKATKDKRIAQLCRDAIKQIDSRKP